MQKYELAMLSLQSVGNTVMYLDVAVKFAARQSKVKSSSVINLKLNIKISHIFIIKLTSTSILQLHVH